MAINSADVEHADCAAAGGSKRQATACQPPGRPGSSATTTCRAQPRGLDSTARLRGEFQPARLLLRPASAILRACREGAFDCPLPSPAGVERLPKPS
jgi:hypothetical protein